MSVLRSQIYYISSENRTSGSSSNFNYIMDLPDGGNFDSCVVLSMSIPLSYYLIRSPYNTFILQEISTNITITVPEGNYDAKSFMTILTTLLNTSSTHLWTYSMTLDVTKAHYTYNVIGNGVNQPQFILSNHLANQTGFNTQSTNSFVSGSLVSTNVLNFVSTNSLFLHSNLIDDTTSVLQEVYSNNTIPYSFIVYNCVNTELYTKRLKTNSAGVFTFSLTDEHGVEINLNGQEINVTLMLYKKLSIGDLFKKYVDMQSLK
jgi:hypothetical protein